MELEVRLYPQNPDRLQWIGGRPGVGLEDRTIVALVNAGRTIWEAAIENEHGYGFETAMTIWVEPAIALVGTRSDVFALDLATGESRAHWELDTPGPKLVFPPGLDRLMIIDWQNIRSITPTLQTAWYARWVAADGIELVTFRDGLMVVNACYDPPDHWETVTLDLTTGEIKARASSEAEL